MRLPSRLRLVSVGLMGWGFVGLYACGGSDGGGGIEADGGTGADGTTPPGTDDSGSSGDGGIGDASLDVDSGSHSVVAGGSCATDGDCVSGGCDYTMHCAAMPSCTAHNGGDTCGPTGTDSCCTTIPVPLPGAAFKLDKYNITAGRFRSFIEKTHGDVRGYIQAHRPSWFEPVWDAWLPNVMDDGTVQTGLPHLYPAGTGQNGVYQQLGPIHYGKAEQGGNEGCLTKEVGNSRTYRLPDAVNKSLFDDVQQYEQDILDQKPQQCVTFFMVAAFCAWDGGRMPTLTELDFAWDQGDPANHTYPWGNTPAPGGWDGTYPYDPTGKGFGKPKPAGSDMTRANYLFNFWMPASIQCIDGDAGACDYSVYIAPPGRFPNGNGPLGHSDLTGNVYNVALPMSGTPGTDPATRTVGLNRTGAFDQHPIPDQHPITGLRNWASTNKYLAVGGRCARD